MSLVVDIVVELVRGVEDLSTLSISKGFSSEVAFCFLVQLVFYVVGGGEGVLVKYVASVSFAFRKGLFFLDD